MMASAAVSTATAATAIVAAVGLYAAIGADRRSAATTDAHSTATTIANWHGNRLRNHDASLNLDLLLNLHWHANVNGALALHRHADGDHTLASLGGHRRLRNLASTRFLDVVAVLYLTRAGLRLVGAPLNGTRAGFRSATGNVDRASANFRTATRDGYRTGLLLDTAARYGTAARFRTATSYSALTRAGFSAATGYDARTSSRFSAAQGYRVVVFLCRDLILIGRYRDLFSHDVRNPDATAYGRRCRRTWNAASDIGAATADCSTSIAGAAAAAVARSTANASWCAAGCAGYFNLLSLIRTAVTSARDHGRHRYAGANLTRARALFGVGHLNGVRLLDGFGIWHSHRVRLFNHLGVRNHHRVRHLFRVRHAYVDRLIDRFRVRNLDGVLLLNGFGVRNVDRVGNFDRGIDGNLDGVRFFAGFHLRNANGIVLLDHGRHRNLASVLLLLLLGDHFRVGLRPGFLLILGNRYRAILGRVLRDHDGLLRVLNTAVGRAGCHSAAAVAALSVDETGRTQRSGQSHRISEWAKLHEDLLSRNDWPTGQPEAPTSLWQHALAIRKRTVLLESKVPNAHVNMRRLSKMADRGKQFGPVWRSGCKKFREVSRRAVRN